MWLVVISCFISRIEKRHAFSQEVRCISGAFDLVNGASRHARHLKESPLFRSRRQLVRLAVENRADEAILSNQAGAHESFHEGFRILKIRVFPRGTI